MSSREKPDRVSNSKKAADELPWNGLKLVPGRLFDLERVEDLMFREVFDSKEDVDEQQPPRPPTKIDPKAVPGRLSDSDSVENFWAKNLPDPE